jgi:hypothetical protein
LYVTISLTCKEHHSMKCISWWLLVPSFGICFGQIRVVHHNFIDLHWTPFHEMLSWWMLVPLFSICFGQIRVVHQNFIDLQRTPFHVMLFWWLLFPSFGICFVRQIRIIHHNFIVYLTSDIWRNSKLRWLLTNINYLSSRSVSVFSKYVLYIKYQLNWRVQSNIMLMISIYYTMNKIRFLVHNESNSCLF